MESRKRDNIISLIPVKHNLLTKAVACLLILAFITTNANYGYTADPYPNLRNIAAQECGRREMIKNRLLSMHDEAERDSYYNKAVEVFGDDICKRLDMEPQFQKHMERIRRSLLKGVRPAKDGRVEVWDPKQIIFMATKRCNKECNHCLFMCSPNDRRRLTKREIRETLDSGNFDFCTLSGGEITTMRDYLDIIEDNPEIQAILTNGVAVSDPENPEIAKRFVNNLRERLVRRAKRKKTRSIKKELKKFAVRISLDPIRGDDITLQAKRVALLVDSIARYFPEASINIGGVRAVKDDRSLTVIKRELENLNYEVTGNSYAQAWNVSSSKRAYVITSTNIMIKNRKTGRATPIHHTTMILNRLGRGLFVSMDNFISRKLEWLDFRETTIGYGDNDNNRKNKTTYAFVDWDGNAAIEEAFLTGPKCFVLGNIRQESFEDILERAKIDPLILAFFNSDGFYYNICYFFETTAPKVSKSILDNAQSPRAALNWLIADPARKIAFTLFMLQEFVKPYSDHALEIDKELFTKELGIDIFDEKTTAKDIFAFAQKLVERERQKHELTQSKKRRSQESASPILPLGIDSRGRSRRGQPAGRRVPPDTQAGPGTAGPVPDSSETPKPSLLGKRSNYVPDMEEIREEASPLPEPYYLDYAEIQEKTKSFLAVSTFRPHVPVSSYGDISLYQSTRLEDLAIRTDDEIYLNSNLMHTLNTAHTDIRQEGSKAIMTMLLIGELSHNGSYSNPFDEYVEEIRGAWHQIEYYKSLSPYVRRGIDLFLESLPAEVREQLNIDEFIEFAKRGAITVEELAEQIGLKYRFKDGPGYRDITEEEKSAAIMALKPDLYDTLTRELAKIFDYTKHKGIDIAVTEKPEISYADTGALTAFTFPLDWALMSKQAKKEALLFAYFEFHMRNSLAGYFNDSDELKTLMEHYLKLLYFNSIAYEKGSLFGFLEAVDIIDPVLSRLIAKTKHQSPHSEMFIYNIADELGLVDSLRRAFDVTQISGFSKNLSSIISKIHSVDKDMIPYLSIDKGDVFRGFRQGLLEILSGSTQEKHEFEFEKNAEITESKHTITHFRQYLLRRPNLVKEWTSIDNLEDAMAFVKRHRRKLRLYMGLKARKFIHYNEIYFAATRVYLLDRYKIDMYAYGTVEGDSNKGWLIGNEDYPLAIGLLTHSENIFRKISPPRRQKHIRLRLVKREIKEREGDGYIITRGQHDTRELILPLYRSDSEITVDRNVWARTFKHEFAHEWHEAPYLEAIFNTRKINFGKINQFLFEYPEYDEEYQEGDKPHASSGRYDTDQRLRRIYEKIAPNYSDDPVHGFVHFVIELIDDPARLERQYPKLYAFLKAIVGDSIRETHDNGEDRRVVPEGPVEPRSGLPSPAPEDIQKPVHALREAA